MSSSKKERSYEDSSWENGAFTEILTQGLGIESNGYAKADENEDNVIYLYELVRYLQSEVPKLVDQKIPKTKTTQNPIIIDGFSKLDIPIFS